MLGLMAVALAVSGYIFLSGDGGSPISGGGGKSAMSLADVGKRAKALQKQAAADALDGVVPAIIQAAREPWRAEAFYAGKAEFAGKGKQEKGRIPVYSGFMELGSQRLAVIDGMEYMVGDQVEGGWELLEIAPGSVVLRNEELGKQITVQYQDPGDVGQ